MNPPEIAKNPRQVKLPHHTGRRGRFFNVCGKFRFRFTGIDHKGISKLFQSGYIPAFVYF
jgi:hypothetical protein